MKVHDGSRKESFYPEKNNNNKILLPLCTVSVKQSRNIPYSNGPHPRGRSCCMVNIKCSTISILLKDVRKTYKINFQEKPIYYVDGKLFEPSPFAYKLSNCIQSAEPPSILRYEINMINIAFQGFKPYNLFLGSRPQIRLEL